MASSGKKGKKPKGKTLALNDFLQETTTGPASIPIRKSSTNWADEVEDTYDSYEGRQSSKQSNNVVLPTAPKAARGLDDFSDKIPQSPPFIAYLSNLPYDVDEIEIGEFFGDLKILNMRIPKEDRVGEGSRVKGYGYVEFEDQENLIGALEIPVTLLKGRRIRIEVATNSENERRGRGGGRMDMNRDRPDRPDVFGSDWRNTPRKEPEQPERRPAAGGGGGGFSREDRGGGGREGSDRGGGFSREGRDGGGGFNRDRDGGDRGGPGGGFNRDRGEGGGGGFNRDRGEGGGGGSFNRDREPGSDKPGAWRDGNDRPSFRDNDRDKGGPMSRDSQRGGDRYGGDREDKGGPMTRDGPRGGDRFGGDRDGADRRGAYGPPRKMDRDDNRGGDRNGGFVRGAPRAGDESRDREQDNEQRARPKLNLAPRTKPIDSVAPPAATTEEKDEVGDATAAAPSAEAPPPAPKPVAATSIFGNAKPVDTTAREREIDDKIAKQSTDHPERETRRDNADNKRRDDKSTIERKMYSPPRRSPEKRGPDDRRTSPEPRKSSLERNRAQIPHEKRGKNEKEKVVKQPPREHTEREMPKLKEAEPLNIVATNQYSFLAADSD